MAKITPKNRMLFIVIMLTSLLQMAPFALTPGIAKIQAEVFPHLSLSVIQTAMTLTNLVSTFTAVLSAVLIGKGLLSKKACVVVGVFLMGATGVVVLAAHSHFWQLCLLGVFIGAGMGFYIAPSASIMFDNFNEEERRLTVGSQSSVINFGGILMSLGGGYLASLIWYGGYLMLLVAIPIAIVSIVAIPGDRRPRGEPARESTGDKCKLPPDIFYYGIVSFFFALTFNVCGTNISSHLKDAQLGGTAQAGIATAIQMAGGVVAGLGFSRLSAKIGDYILPLAFTGLFAGFMILAAGVGSLAVNFIGIFIVGMTISIMVPQCLFATSNRVDATNSSMATAVVNCILPGAGGFFSPIVFTNLTTALGGPSTVFRFWFMAGVCLVFGLALLLLTRYRARRPAAPSGVI